MNNIMSNQQGHVSYVKLMRFIELFTFPHGGNRNQQQGGCHFDVESGIFKGKFGTLMWPSGTLMFTFNPFFFFFMMPFRPRVMLSLLFVCKIQPEVCSSVCECS